jgi:hypothetical protein
MSSFHSPRNLHKNEEALLIERLARAHSAFQPPFELFISFFLVSSALNKVDCSESLKQASNLICQVDDYDGGSRD